MTTVQVHVYGDDISELATNAFAEGEKFFGTGELVLIPGWGVLGSGGSKKYQASIGVTTRAWQNQQKAVVKKFQVACEGDSIEELEFDGLMKAVAFFGDNQILVIDESYLAVRSSNYAIQNDNAKMYSANITYSMTERIL